jgi:hypothetical protein
MSDDQNPSNRAWLCALDRELRPFLRSFLEPLYETGRIVAHGHTLYNIPIRLPIDAGNLFTRITVTVETAPGKLGTVCIPRIVAALDYYYTMAHLGYFHHMTAPAAKVSSGPFAEINLAAAQCSKILSGMGHSLLGITNKSLPAYISRAWEDPVKNWDRVVHTRSDEQAIDRLLQEIYQFRVQPSSSSRGNLASCVVFYGNDMAVVPETMPRLTLAQSKKIVYVWTTDGQTTNIYGQPGAALRRQRLPAILVRVLGQCATATTAAHLKMWTRALDNFKCYIRIACVKENHADMFVQLWQQEKQATQERWDMWRQPTDLPPIVDSCNNSGGSGGSGRSGGASFGATVCGGDAIADVFAGEPGALFAGEFDDLLDADPLADLPESC